MNVACDGRQASRQKKCRQIACTATKNTFLLRAGGAHNLPLLSGSALTPAFCQAMPVHNTVAVECHHTKKKNSPKTKITKTAEGRRHSRRRSLQVFVELKNTKRGTWWHPDALDDPSTICGPVCFSRILHGKGNVKVDVGKYQK